MGDCSECGKALTDGSGVVVDGDPYCKTCAGFIEADLMRDPWDEVDETEA
jgi:hypothetical protein